VQADRKRKNRRGLQRGAAALGNGIGRPRLQGGGRMKMDGTRTIAGRGDAMLGKRVALVYGGINRAVS